MAIGSVHIYIGFEFDWLFSIRNQLKVAFVFLQNQSLKHYYVIITATGDGDASG